MDIGKYLGILTLNDLKTVENDLNLKLIILIHFSQQINRLKNISLVNIHSSNIFIYFLIKFYSCFKSFKQRRYTSNIF